MTSSAQLHVGAASIPITPETGRQMAGYAARTSAATGVLDELSCRVVVLRQGPVCLAVVALDVLYTPARLATGIAAAVAQQLDANPEGVLVSATHTHCGPTIGDEPVNAGLYQRLVGAAQEAAGQAGDRLQPAQLVRTSFPVAGLVHNRRRPGVTTQSPGTVLAALHAESSEPVAVVVSVPCHPTVLDAHTHAYSPDYPGALREAVETGCGAPTIFLQGFSGDLNPVVADHSAADARLLGRVLGARAVSAVLTAQLAERSNTTQNISAGRRLPVDVPDGGRLVAPVRLAAARRDVAVEAKPLPDPVTIDEQVRHAERAATDATSTEDREAASRRVPQLRIEGLMAQRPPYIGMDYPPSGRSTLPVQVLSLTPEVHIVALPGEPLDASAQTLREELGDDVVLVGCANHAGGYLPPTAERDGYEVGATRYAPGTVERLHDAAIAMVRDSAFPGGAGTGLPCVAETEPAIGQETGASPLTERLEP